ncbi:YxiJ-like family protein [Bacillus sp. UNC41MFS5]|uniref:YxiJ-like family protein n=1 Tax=Bacillus sp. UNC41MFS5 TaxID=1449046 RepID=UPI000A750BD0|nr:YxiJ-like family protein [Bacillus sp. UNC41MFS5]
MKIYEELKTLKESLYNPFPYKDTDKIQEDFYKELSEEDCLTGDLNTFWMNIAGSLIYVLRGNSKRIPQGQIEWLHFSFFDIFHQYRFLEEKMADYPTFYEEYRYNEKARKLLLDYLSFN